MEHSENGTNKNTRDLTFTDVLSFTKKILEGTPHRELPNWREIGRAHVDLIHAVWAIEQAQNDLKKATIKAQKEYRT